MTNLLLLLLSTCSTLSVVLYQSIFTREGVRMFHLLGSRQKFTYAYVCDAVPFRYCSWEERVRLYISVLVLICRNLVLFWLLVLVFDVMRCSSAGIAHGPSYYYICRKDVPRK